jgi:hypothetical protein
MAGSYRSVVNGLLNGVPVANVFHWVTPDDDDNDMDVAVDINNKLDAGAEGFMEHYANIVPTDWIGTTLNTTGIVVPGYGTIATPPQILDISPWEGQRVGTVLSNQDSPFVAMYANMGNLPPGLRQRVGKLFIPGVSEADASEDSIVNDLALAIADFVSITLTGINLAGVSDLAYRLLCTEEGNKYLVDVVDNFIRINLGSQNKRRPNFSYGP